MAPSPCSVRVPGVRPTARAAPAPPASSAPVSAGDSGSCWGPCGIAPLTAVRAAAYSGFRLGNSSSGCSGRVEVAVRGTWGSVCASEWDLADAHVLCRHLGCGRASSVPPGGSFGSGEGPLRPDAFGCRGSERHPGECPVAVLGKPPCVPGNAAAVKCSGVQGGSAGSLTGFWVSAKNWQQWTQEYFGKKD
ncbi:scavenger receptor cysteine-rich domain-containing protein SCART1-like [Lonchura striata]